MELLSSALGVVGALAVIVSAVLVGMNRSKDQAIDAQNSTITALQAQVLSIEEQRVASERECEKQIAALTARVDTLAEQQTEVLTAMLAPRIVDGLVAAIHEGRLPWERRHDT